MSDVEPQSYQNHRRYVIGFHAATFGILIVNLIWSSYRTVTSFSVDRLMSVLLVIGVLLLFYYTRTFATTVQDRVICLEEKLRLARLLPADLAARVDEFTIGQLIALRFASDEEVPALARRVRGEGIRDREEIKKLIQAWRPDYHRV